MDAVDVPLKSKVEVLEHIVRGHELDETLDLICRQAETIDPLARCCVMTLDPLAGRLRMAAAPSLPAIFYAEMDAIDVKSSQISCARAANSKNAEFAKDISDHDIFPAFQKLAVEACFDACWSQPILNDQSEVLGTLDMYWSQNREPDEEAKQLMRSQAELCALAIEHAETKGVLRQSEMTSRALLEGSPVCNKIIDMDSRLVYMSRAGVDMLKIPDIQARYGSIYPPDFYAEEMRAPLVEHLERAKAGERSDVECPMTSTDGREVWLHTTFVPVSESEGSVAYVIASSVDITERKLAEQAAMRALTVAERANQSKSAFLANMSHDLRTPLNAIIGFTQMMETKVFGPLGNPRYEQYAKDILNSGNLLVSLINDILDLSKIEAGKYEINEEPIDMNAAIEDSIKMLSTNARAADLRVIPEIQAGIPKLSADRRSVVQVLNNLLSNAIKFTPRNGEVHVSAERMEGCIKITVQDTGIGMSEDDVHRVLRPFEQVGSNTTQPNDGTGLGLHLCQQLVELHDGELALSSEIDVGTCVTVTFPDTRTIAD